MTAGPDGRGRGGAPVADPPDSFDVPSAVLPPDAEPPRADGGGRGSGPGAPRLGLVGWLRWSWRQLTSMRTALILLFLLAIASVPGSVLPQQGIDPSAVSQYYVSHPTLAPILNRFSLFSVFAAPWFAAIYILLFLSLAGCVLPRTLRLVGAARQQPPRAPRRLGRLPMAASFTTALPPDEALAAAGRFLGGRRFRLRPGDGWLSAEKGYLREVGNLLFHIALLALLVSVGLGGIFGYKANRLLVAGSSFADTPTALDVYRPGRLVTASDLAPFSVALQRFSASYVTSGPQADEPETFNAALRYTAAPGGRTRSYNLQVNHPLVVDGVSVYLIGHGYAPQFKVTNAQGTVVFNEAVPFIPVEQSGLTSEGVIKVSGASPEQLGFAGVFFPSAALAADGRLESDFPAPRLPRVSLVTYAGNLGLRDGQSQSVYQLDLSGMHRLSVSAAALAPGQSVNLPDGEGTITFVGYRQWISLAITHDPGQLPALVSAVLALLGLILSFMVRRRRVFVRAVASPDGVTVVDVGGLARSDAAGGFEVEFAELARDLRASQDGRARAVSAAVAGPEGEGAAGGEPGGGEPADDDEPLRDLAVLRDLAAPDAAGTPAAGVVPDAGLAAGERETAPDGAAAASRPQGSLDDGPVPGPAPATGSASAEPVSSDNDQSLGTPEGE
jgi:cytochrome c biogenesis protein